MYGLKSTLLFLNPQAPAEQEDGSNNTVETLFNLQKKIRNVADGHNRSVGVVLQIIHDFAMRECELRPTTYFSL